MRNHPAAVSIPWFHLEGETFEHVYPQGEAGNHEESIDRVVHIDHPIATHQSEETVEDFNSQFKPLAEINKTDAVLDDITPRKKKLIRTVRKQTHLLKKKLIAFISSRGELPRLMLNL